MNQRERMKIAVDTGISLATITKWDKGISVNSVLADRIKKEAKKNGSFREREEYEEQQDEGPTK